MDTRSALSTPVSLAVIVALGLLAFTLLGSGVAAASGCSGSQDSVVSVTAQSVTGTSAVLRGTVNTGGCRTAYSFDYGPTPTYGSNTPVANAHGSINASVVTAKVTGLNPQTTYHFELLLTGIDGTAVSSDATFTTLGSCGSGGQLPSVQTGAATITSSARATLAGVVNGNGCRTTYGFEIGTTSAYGRVVKISTPITGTNVNSVTVAHAIAGLRPLTTYHFRIEATSASGTSDGADQTFTTPALAAQQSLISTHCRVGRLPQPSAPAASSAAATHVGNNGALLNGTVSPNGCNGTYQFQYGLTSAYGSSTSAHTFRLSDSVAAATTHITGLAPNSVYHFRVVATSPLGVVYGADETFTTETACRSGSGVPPSVTTRKAIKIAGERATLRGTINPHGCVVTYRFEYGRTLSYGTFTRVLTVPAGSAPVTVTFRVPLSANQTYHYVLLATTASGASTGLDQTFKTRRGASVLILTRRASIASSFRTRVSLRCAAGVRRCSGAVKLIYRGQTLGSARFRLVGRARHTVDIELNTAGRKLLALEAHLKVEIRATGAAKLVSATLSRAVKA